MSAPNKYSDPFWSELSSKTESKLGLPEGLLATIVSHGERSNNDQVSEAGAKTPFQITPSTRKLAIDKYGIDPYLSSENAAEVAGLLLKDSLKRNNNDVSQAVGEYHGGTNRKNWGPRTKAYIARVSDGLEAKQIENMTADFQNWLAEKNAKIETEQPEQQVDSAQPDESPNPEDEFNAGLQNWLAEKNKPQPEKATGYDFGPNDSIVASSVMHPIQAVEKASDWLTNQVNTAAGIPEQYDNPNPLLGVDPERQAAAAFNVAGLGQTGAIAPAAVKVAESLTPTAVKAVEAVKNVGQPAKEMLNRVVGKAVQEAPQSNPMIPQSGGSAAVDLADQRIANAQSLDVPIDLTRAEATRLPTHQQREDMLARGPFGEKLHEAANEKNQKLYQNLDMVIDGTNATAHDLESVGVKLDSVLKKKMETARLRIGAEYKKADNSPEADLPVSLDKTIATLNSNEKWFPQAGDALDLTKRRLLELGAVKEKQIVQDGVEKTILVKNKDLSQKDVEKGLYQFINENSSSIERKDRAKLRDIKTAINEDLTALDGSSPLYAKARATNRKFIEDFESHKVIKDLTTKKLGTEDRKIAIEHVFNKTILAENRSIADLQHLKNVLIGGKRTKEGTQVWNELRGQFAKHIREEAFEKNNSTNTLGEQVVSAAKLNQAIKKYTKNGKLDFMLGTRDAEKVRTIGEVANYIFTHPPKTVNASGTAGQLTSIMFDVAGSGVMTGLPLPLVHTLKYVKAHINNVKVQKEIQQILNYSKTKAGKF